MNSKAKEKVVGILGGMGPEATRDLFDKIIKATSIKREQDHLRIIIDNNPKIPNRTEFILGQGENPLPLLQETARNLESAGVDFIVIPCNTAFHFYSDIQKVVRIPVVHLIEETVKAVRSRMPSLRSIGLLATTGTLRSRLYQEAFEKVGVEVIIPGKEEQEVVMRAMTALKEGAGDREEIKEELLQIGERLVESGAQGLVIGCTDLPLVLTPDDIKVPCFDSTEILARATVVRATNVAPTGVQE